MVSPELSTRLEPKHLCSYLWALKVRLYCTKNPGLKGSCPEPAILSMVNCVTRILMSLHVISRTMMTLAVTSIYS